MKKAILIFGFLIVIMVLSAQSYATFRLGSTDASTLSPGELVYVPVYCDDISGTPFSLVIIVNYDSDVLTWNGSFGNPLTGVQNFHPSFPYGTPNGTWFFNDNGTTLTAFWDGPINSSSINPGDTFFELIFTYQGGETLLAWGLDSGCCSIMTLINGCVCSPIPHPVVFHVISDGGDFIEDAEIIVDNETLMTNGAGNAVFYRTDGNYSYTVNKEGFADEEGTLTVAGAPQLIEVEMEECWDVSICVIGCDSATININGVILITDENGCADTCLMNGDYYISIGCEGFWGYTGMMIVNNSPVTLNIMLMPITYSVTFFVNCCGEPLENIPITYEGQTIMTNVAGLAMLNMPAGFYSFEIGGVPITFTVPDTVYVPVDICSEVTFQITFQGMPIVGASVTVDGETLVTNPDGIAVFCLQNGIHAYIITHPDMETLTGEFIVNNEPLILIFDLYIPPWYYPVQFQVSNYNCENSFEGLFIVCNGDTIQSGETIELESGLYNWELIFEGCSTLENGMVEVNFAPVTVEIAVPWLPQVTFHVTDQWLADFEGAVINIEGDILITDNDGMASFCMTGGYHDYWVANPGYDTVPGNFVFPCQDTTIEFMLMTGSIGEDELNLLDIYPNPSTGKFSIENLNQTGEPTEIFVTDITGRIIYKGTSSVMDKTEIDLTGQPKGMYFVRAKAGEMLVNRRVVIW